MIVNNFLNSSVFRLHTLKEVEEEGAKPMNWIPLYITGREGFCEEVRKKIDQANVNLMPGYTGAIDTYALYWVDDQLDLRELKEAIGGKLVWKYRLRFLDLQDFIESQQQANESATLTDEELARIEEMRSVA